MFCNGQFLEYLPFRKQKAPYTSCITFDLILVIYSAQNRSKNKKQKNCIVTKFSNLLQMQQEGACVGTWGLGDSGVGEHNNNNNNNNIK